MKITIDTKKDSREEIKHAITLLSNTIGKKQPELNIDNNSKEKTIETNETTKNAMSMFNQNNTTKEKKDTKETETQKKARKKRKKQKKKPDVEFY